MFLGQQDVSSVSGTVPEIPGMLASMYVHINILVWGLVTFSIEVVFFTHQVHGKLIAVIVCWCSVPLPQLFGLVAMILGLFSGVCKLDHVEIFTALMTCTCMCSYKGRGRHTCRHPRVPWDVLCNCTAIPRLPQMGSNYRVLWNIKACWPSWTWNSQKLLI